MFQWALSIFATKLYKFFPFLMPVPYQYVVCNIPSIVQVNLFLILMMPYEAQMFLILQNLI